MNSKKMMIITTNVGSLDTCNIKYDLKWQIDDIQRYFYKDESFIIRSPSFKTNTTANEKLSWTFQLCSHHKHLLGLLIDFQCDTDTPVWASLICTISNGKNKLSRCVCSNRSFTKKSHVQKLGIAWQRDFVGVENNATAIITCSITIHGVNPETVDPLVLEEFNDLQKESSKIKLFEELDFIPLDQLVETDDIITNLLIRFFQFILPKGQSDKEKILIEIFDAVTIDTAKKYDLPLLNINYVLKLLELSERYHEENLKSTAIKYLISNKKEYLHEPEFEAFYAEHPIIAYRMIRAMADEDNTS